jgi:hypothetical protein
LTASGAGVDVLQEDMSEGRQVKARRRRWRLENETEEWGRRMEDPRQDLRTEFRAATEASEEGRKMEE